SLTAINFVTVTQFLERPLFGWTLLPEQSAFWATALFAGLMFFIILLFFWKKQQPFKIIIFLFLWIAIFYLPNFLTQSFTKSGIPMESRYYAISAVGLAGLLAFGFSFIKTRYLNQIILGFLIFNIYVVNQSLIKDSTFRSINVYNKIWDKIDRDVPKDEKNSIFMYTGADYSLRTRLLDWQDSIPFAIKRGITKKEDYPIVTNDKNLIAKLICERNILRHSPFGDLMQKEPIPLSHVHAWELKNGELVDRSEEERRGITAKCLVDQKR
ncbi:MAG: hypothetical protein M1338_02350, partial [Patescibacteria group bacterium]|nr:hypothetical protein [Patescibacteria group bacterium]